MTKEENKKPKHSSHAHKTLPAKKVFDVTRPGKAPAAPNSRSVVPSAKPPVPDDQFVPATAPVLRASDPAAKHELLDGSHRKGVLPLHETAAEEAPLTPQIPSAPTIGEAPKPEVAPEPPTPSADPTPPAPTTAPETPMPPTSAAAHQEISAATASAQPEEGAAHLAMEQTVQADKDIPIWEHPATSEQVEATPPTHQDTAGKPAKTIEDLLAETGAPTLEPEKAPSLIVSHHHKHTPWWEPILVFISILLLGAILLNFLLDADIIRTTLDLPHTNWL